MGIYRSNKVKTNSVQIIGKNILKSKYLQLNCNFKAPFIISHSKGKDTGTYVLDKTL